MFSIVGTFRMFDFTMRDSGCTFYISEKVNIASFASFRTFALLISFEFVLYYLRNAYNIVLLFGIFTVV